jgi:peptide/nickel transport system substrate-binding protein
MSSPLTNFTINSSCGGDSWLGWPCDTRTEELRDAYIRASDEAPNRAALEALHRRLWEMLPDIPVGQYLQPFAWRSNVTGVLRAPLLVFWNVDKE